MTLPSDVPRCVSTQCGRCKECARWVTSADTNARVFIVGNPSNCEFFIRYEPKNPKGN